MANGKWIWYPGDFDIWHSLLLHSRRYERGVHIPCQWNLPTPFPNVSFSRDFDIPAETEFTCRSTAPGVVTVSTGQFPHGSRKAYGTGEKITIHPASTISMFRSRR